MHGSAFSFLHCVIICINSCMHKLGQADPTDTALLPDCS